MRILRQHNRECRWTPLLIRNYRNKISGPLLDRIDIHIEVPSVGYQELSGLNAGEPSAKIRERVIAARNIQKKRFKGLPSTRSGRGRKVHCDAAMRAKDMSKFCRLKENAQSLLKMAINELNFSAPPSFNCSVTTEHKPRLRPHPQGCAHHRRPGRFGTD